MRYVLFSLLFLSRFYLFGQTAAGVQITFYPSYNNTPLSLSDVHEKPAAQDALQIETLKFYISQVELYQGNERVFAEANSFHLLDAADTSSLSLYLKPSKPISFSHIKFSLGIDSLTNVSGAFGGDLDPTNGMYWTWQSGYINFKLEGAAAECPARNKQFQFHIGGYQQPYNTLQKVELRTSNPRIIKVDVAIDKFLSKINLAETYQVMSPNQKALTTAQLLPSIFSVSK